MKNKKATTVQEPQLTYGKSNESLDFEKVWLLFQETDKKFKESERLLTEQIQETNRNIKDSERLLTRKFQETDKQFKETDKRIKELSGLFTTQWGKLVEALVAPTCLRLFRERGIGVTQSSRNVKTQHEGTQMECDVILANGDLLVVIEVKTTCRPEDVKDFITTLNDFKKFFKQYTNYKVMGAVAAINYEGKSDVFAYRNGLFVLRTSGEGIIEIANDLAFCPAEFS